MDTPEICPPEMTEKYVARRSKEFVVVRKALETRDASVLRETFHRWKGNAALYGLVEFGVLAGELVTELDRLPSVDAAEGWKRLEEGIARLESCLTIRA